MTDKQLSSQQAFMEKLSDRVRDDIGELLPDEVPADLVAKQIESMFKATKRVPKPGRGGWSSETIEVPSDINNMIIEHAKFRIEEAMNDYFTTYEEEINKMIYDAVKHYAVNAFGQFISGTVSSMIISSMETSKSVLWETMQQHNNNSLYGGEPANFPS